ncbi:MAG: hypothetical protein ACREV6_05950 [Clostridium sp.]|uniref:hypothetical protein n=1 Tax=Clostridium sp. TaxID=1506 RepID=UPI003D6D03AD
MGIGIVNEKGYEYDGDRKEFNHLVHVDWNMDYKEKVIEPRGYRAFKTLYNITENLYNEIIGKSIIVKTSPKLSTIQSISSTEKPVVEVFTVDEKFLLY